MTKSWLLSQEKSESLKSFSDKILKVRMRLTAMKAFSKDDLCVFQCTEKEVIEDNPYKKKFAKEEARKLVEETKKYYEREKAIHIQVGAKGGKPANNLYREEIEICGNALNGYNVKIFYGNYSGEIGKDKIEISFSDLHV